MLTVLLATHNGERTLPAVLEAYRCIDAPQGGWKLVIVDSASTDSTPEVLSRFESLLPLTHLRVAEAGKNRALNAGLATIEGDLVVLTDDDAAPAANWLQEMRRAADTHAAFDIFGGAIVPRWEREPEPWLLNWVLKGVTYSITDENMNEGPIGAAQVWGPNMAVRARLFAQGHCFNETIGPSAGASYAMGSETEFTLRMEANGHRAWFASRATVAHMIRSFQMEESWVFRRASRYGRGMFRWDRQRGLPLGRTVFGVPRWLLRNILTNALALVSDRLKGNSEKAFHRAWDLYCHCGYVAEARKFARTG